MKPTSVPQASLINSPPIVGANNFVLGSTVDLWKSSNVILLKIRVQATIVVGGVFVQQSLHLV